MIKYRPHRGGLKESLREQKEVTTIDDLYAIVSRQMGCKVVFLRTKHTGMDDRINWDTYMVLARFENHKEVMGGYKHAIPVGYADGDLSSLHPLLKK